MREEVGLEFLRLSPSWKAALGEFLEDLARGGDYAPSLGIALSAKARGAKLGEAFMAFLHAAARRQGAKQARLKVQRDNIRAIKLYERVGYQLQAAGEDKLVGFRNL